MSSSLDHLYCISPIARLQLVMVVPAACPDWHHSHQFTSIHTDHPSPKCHPANIYCASSRFKSHTHTNQIRLIANCQAQIRDTQLEMAINQRFPVTKSVLKKRYTSIVWQKGKVLQLSQGQLVPKDSKVWCDCRFWEARNGLLVQRWSYLPLGVPN